MNGNLRSSRENRNDFGDTRIELEDGKTWKERKMRYNWEILLIKEDLEQTTIHNVRGQPYS
jgi:hypothetical protein